MKAVFYNRHGGPEVLEYDDMPDPVAGPGEVLVDVHTASINAADWKVRGGKRFRPPLPHIPGRDFSGVIAALGEGVDDLAVGDRVYGVLDRGVEGTYAEKLVTPARLVCKLPDDVSHAVAVSLALAGLTSTVTLEECLELQPGESVLIQGGAGGVAGFSVQLAKHIGAKVITTCSAANVEYCRSLGADMVIDYNAEDFTKVLSNIDVVFDTIGDEVYLRSFEVMRPGGRITNIAYMEPAKPPRDDVDARKMFVERDRPHLERILELYLSGAIKAPEMREFPLSEASEAQRLSEGRHFRGKLILRVRGED
jgi:NADPH:quinone reductase-like Zn-dependent oxidoreductase